MKTAFSSILVVLLAASDPPYDPKVINPNDDKEMVAALADRRIPREVKDKLLELFEKRLWPQEIVDPRDGSTWVYRAGRPPQKQ